MAIWFILIGMTAAVVAVLLIPFQRRGRSLAPTSDADFAVAIYRDQLAELDRDVARGVIAASEADAARNEVSRRLLQAGSTPGKAPPMSHSRAWLVVLLVPLVALPLYVRYGAPTVQDVPLQPRLQGAIANQDLAALVATVETHLSTSPDDLEGWRVIAPVYKRQNRWADAAQAFSQILRLQPPSAEGLADYAEMLVFANDGMVTADAQQVFERALAMDAKNPRARFFDALALKQEGKTTEAEKRFAEFLAQSPADAPWRATVEAELSQLNGSRAPALDKDQVAALQSLPEGERNAAITGMIDGLEKRLGNNSRDLAGWLRLIRARSVSNDATRARTSLALALNLFKDEPASLLALQRLAHELELQ